MKLSQQNTEKENDSYYDQESEAYKDMFGVDKYQSDWTTRMIKFVVGILLLIFSIVWSYKALL